MYVGRRALYAKRPRIYRLSSKMVPTDMIFSMFQQAGDTRKVALALSSPFLGRGGSRAFARLSFRDSYFNNVSVIRANEINLSGAVVSRLYREFSRTCTIASFIFRFAFDLMEARTVRILFRREN